MNLPEVIKDLPIQCEKNLSALYESICDEYRRRLCELWDVVYEESWWHGDKAGGGLFIGDWWMPLDMEELRYIVDNSVLEKTWLEYCDFCESEIHDGKAHPRINFESWMKGLRPEMLKD